MAKVFAAPTWQRALILLTGTVVGVVLVATLYWARVVLIPVALAIFLTFLLTPAVKAFQKRGLPHPSVIVVVVLTAMLLGGLGWLVTWQATRLLDKLPDYATNIKDKVKTLRELGSGAAVERLEKMLDKVASELNSESVQERGAADRGPACGGRTIGWAAPPPPRTARELGLAAGDPVQEERATDDPLNGLVLQRGPRLARGRGAAHAAQPPAADPPALQRGDGERRAGAQQRRRRRRSSAPSRRASIRRSQGRREARDRRGRRAAARARCDAVGSLADDEVLRGFENLVRAALRTNFYQRPERPVVAIKVDSRKVEGMPSPRPMFEIYVHSRQLEGIHLRGGKVARGGIRWSDRHDDFRTEVLGLMKTQMVKNAIIVPGRVQGRLRAEGRRAAAAGARRLPDRPLPRVRLRPARRHRQHRGRQGRCIRRKWCATTTTTRTSWSPRTRARRTSPTPPTACPRSTASGSATRSPPAAATATTTRR